MIHKHEIILSSGNSIEVFVNDDPPSDVAGDGEILVVLDLVKNEENGESLGGNEFFRKRINQEKMLKHLK